MSDRVFSVSEVAEILNGLARHELNDSWNGACMRENSHGEWFRADELCEAFGLQERFKDGSYYNGTEVAVKS